MNFKTDFLLDERIKLGSRLNDELIAQAEKQLCTELPPTFKSWLKKYGDGVEFNIGNCLWINPLYGDDDDSVFSNTEFFRNWEYCDLKDIIVFARGGGDSETWAFYTGVKDNKGEFPVIWITPGSIGDDGFVICNTNFENFINIYANFLLETDKDDCTDEEADNIWIRLYKKFEPNIIMETSNMYEIAITTEELRKQAKLLYASQIMSVDGWSFGTG